MRTSISRDTARAAVLAAAFIAFFDMAVAAAQAPQGFQYAVKFVCGRSPANAQVTPPVAPGFYFTAINVHNPNPGPIEFRKKFAQALPNQKAGRVSRLFPASLKEDEAFEVDCPEISRGLDIRPGVFVKGFVVFQTELEIDVVAVYTTAASAIGNVTSMTAERVPKRP
jgi:hypothetical protein